MMNSSKWVILTMIMISNIMVAYMNMWEDTLEK